MIPINSGYVAGVALSEIDGQLKMLLMKRTKGNYWCHVAGSIEANESACEAMVREFAEETQIRVEKLYNAHYLDQFFVAEANLLELIPIFVVQCPPEQSVVLNHEHSEYQWCTLSEAVELAPYPNQHAVYQHVWRYFVERPIDPQFAILVER